MTVNKVTISVFFPVRLRSPGRGVNHKAVATTKDRRKPINLRSLKKFLGGLLEICVKKIQHFLHIVWCFKSRITMTGIRQNLELNVIFAKRGS